MTLDRRGPRKVVIAGTLAGLLLLPSTGGAVGLTVQTAGNPSNAAAGEFGASVDASALLTVLVTRDSDGAPVSDLGASVGDGTGAITLPRGWTLTTLIVPAAIGLQPGQGCPMTPTEFTNGGGGIYLIRVVPDLRDPTCVWLFLDYHYAVQIRFHASTETLRGGGLGLLQIPVPLVK
jgi:hypothetical protein